MTDERLIRDALTGRQRAYAALVERYQRAVFDLIIRLIGDSGVAAELAEDTFLKAFGRLESFDQRRGFSPWLLRIAHNTAVDAQWRGHLETVAIRAGPRGHAGHADGVGTVHGASDGAVG